MTPIAPPAVDAPAAADPARAEPIGAGERIAALDVLRGVALLGIFVMNMTAFGHSIFAPPAAQGLHSADGIAALLRDWLFAGKFILLFGFAFGAGFAIQLGRLEAAAPSRAVSLLRRRLAVLAAIGIVHAALLWPGDVLVAYAGLGFALLAARRLRGPALLAVLLFCLVGPAAIEGAVNVFAGDPDFIAGTIEMAGHARRHDIAFGTGSLADAVAETLRTFATMYGGLDAVFTLFVGWLQLAVGIVVGWWIGRRGFLLRLRELSAPIRRLQGAAAVAVVACAATYVYFGGFGVVPGQPAPFGAALARGCGRLALATFYATTIVRIAMATHTPSVAAALRLLATAGRMPLSNYLLQTVLGTAVFYAWGLGLWNRTGAAAETAIAVALYLLVLLPLSWWWLGRFRFGPVEWLWRTLTYGGVGARRPNSAASRP